MLGRIDPLNIRCLPDARMNYEKRMCRFGNLEEAELSTRCIEILRVAIDSVRSVLEHDDLVVAVDPERLKVCDIVDTYR